MISMKTEALLEQKYFNWRMPLLTLNHSSKTCGGPKAFTSSTILKKCGGKTSSGYCNNHTTITLKHVQSMQKSRIKQKMPWKQIRK